MPSVRAVLAGVNPSLRQCLGWGHNGNSGLCQAEDKDWLSSIDRCEPLRHTVCVGRGGEGQSGEGDRDIRLSAHLITLTTSSL